MLIAHGLKPGLALPTAIPTERTEVQAVSSSK